MNDDFKSEVRRRWGNRRSQKGRRLAGIVFLVIGGLLFARSAGADLPDWLFTWPMILIAIGLYTGIKHGFRSPAPFILLVIGGVFLADRMTDDINLRPFLWPSIFIAIGASIIFRPKGRFCRDDNWTDPEKKTGDENTVKQSDWYSATPDHNDVIDITTIFGGVKKRVLSKNFRGGDIVSVMGGTELDLSQADFKGVVRIDTFTMFGGTKLIIPPDWDVQSEVVAIFGGIDDKRPQAANYDPSKKIFLEGTCLFGGIEIKSF